MAEIEPVPLCRLRSRRGDGFLVLELHGELDLAALDTLLPRMERAIQGPVRWIVVDLSAVGFIDASGIRLLHLAQACVRRNGGTARLVCPAGFVRRILDLVGITRGLPTVATLSEALPAAPMSSA